MRDNRARGGQRPINGLALGTRSGPDAGPWHDQKLAIILGLGCRASVLQYFTAQVLSLEHISAGQFTGPSELDIEY